MDEKETAGQLSGPGNEVESSARRQSLATGETVPDPQEAGQKSTDPVPASEAAVTAAPPKNAGQGWALEAEAGDEGSEVAAPGGSSGTEGVTAGREQDRVTGEAPNLARDSRSKMDRTSPWWYFGIGTFLVIAVTVLMWNLHQVAPPANSTETGIRAEVGLFLAIPGVSLAVLAAYMLSKMSQGWVQHRLRIKDHLITAVQLLPGTALAAIGNLLPTDHELVKAWGINPAWASLALGVLVSFLLVRKFEKPEPPVTSPESE